LIKVQNFTKPALLASVSFSLMASCFSCGFNILPGSAFSREGSGFYTMRALPVDFSDYYKSKRNFSLLVCLLGSVLYVIVLGIVSMAAGFISPADSWTILAGAACSFFLDLLLISLMLLRDSKKPRLNWDSETEISRKLSMINIISIIVGIIVFIIFFVVVLLAPFLNEADIMLPTLIVCAAVLLSLAVLALTADRLAVRKASKNLMAAE